LAPVAISLLHEAQADGARLGTLPPEALATLIKAVPVRLSGVADIAKAISTAGGVAFEAIDPGYMLRKKPGTFVAGEMLDWEAPTGGYLLQACFATGVAAGQGALAWSKSQAD
jgi:predicted flavoprotein YhiN